MFHGTMNFLRFIIHGCMVTLVISAQRLSSDIKNPGLPSTKSSREILETLLSAENVTFLNSRHILEGKKKVPNMRKLQMAVAEENRVFAIDFTDTNDEKHADSLKQIILSKLAIHISCDLLIVSRYKNGIMFTPVDDVKDPDVVPLLTTTQLRKIMMRSTEPQTKGSQSSSKDGDQPVPNISFYLNIQYNIPHSKCSFNKSPDQFVKGQTMFCKNPHISLIFQVNLQRSLKFGISGGATPDAKIVRISADANTGGAGIHLNDELVYHRYVKRKVVLNGLVMDWSASAIASDYTVDVKASNKKANVLKTVPQNNLNPGTQFREISGFTLGISGDVEVGSKTGAKARLGASASYTQQRWVMFETHDYKMERLTSGPQNIKFRMARETYAKASSLLKKHTNPIWKKDYPADLKRVQAMGYASYVPKLDVVYAASSEEIGTTEFSVDASVGIMPLYHAAYKHYYVIGSHLSYRGSDYDRKGIPVSCNKRFTVDWEHAVFTGGRPVNLQSTAFPDECIEINSNGKISVAKGDISSEKQSFIFDEFGRYRSAMNLKMCLDASNLDMLQPCSTSLTQRWEWEKGSDHLTNLYIKGKLGYDKSTRKFGIFKQDSDTVITGIITAHTQLFSCKIT